MDEIISVRNQVTLYIIGMLIVLFLFCWIMVGKNRETPPQAAKANAQEAAALDKEINTRVGKLEYDSLVLARKWSLIKNPTTAQLEEMVKEKEALEQEWEKIHKWVFEEFEKLEKRIKKLEGEIKKENPER